MATESGFWQDFRHWRRRRPFWGGLVLLIAGLELFLSANLSLGDMQVHIGPQGFLSYLLPLMLLLCGLLSWFTPAQRLFYGILGLLTALYSMIGLNFGGYFFGMLIGIFGGALVIAWTPERRPSTPAPADPDDSGAPDSVEEDAPAADDASTQFLPGFSDPVRAPQPAAPGFEGDPPPPPSSGSAHRKAFVIVLVPLLVTAGVLVGGSRTPARADTCPEGLPSRSTSTSASPSESTTTSSESTAKKSAAKKKAAAKKSATGSASTSATPSSSASAAADDEQSDPSLGDQIKDGVTDLVNGVGDLLGIGDDESASPSPSASSSAPAPAPSASASSGGEPAPSTSASPTPGGSASSGSASPSPTPTSTDIPCLGPRVLDKLAGPDDVPFVSVNGATLETKSLTMYNATYDGVSTLKTVSGGTIKALKFSMTKAVNKPFTLTVPEKDGHTTLIKSNELTTDGNVKFYTPSFKGKLFGIIPVTFTPEQPPPLMLPVLWFTDVTIHLAFVRCDTLTADPLDLTEPN